MFVSYTFAIITFLKYMDLIVFKANSMIYYDMMMMIHLAPSDATPVDSNFHGLRCLQMTL